MNKIMYLLGIFLLIGAFSVSAEGLFEEKSFVENALSYEPQSSGKAARSAEVIFDESLVINESFGEYVYGYIGEVGVSEDIINGLLRVSRAAYSNNVDKFDLIVLEYDNVINAETIFKGLVIEEEFEQWWNNGRLIYYFPEYNQAAWISGKYIVIIASENAQNIPDEILNAYLNKYNPDNVIITPNYCSRPERTITGTVYEQTGDYYEDNLERGNPIANVELEVYDYCSESKYLVETDANGKFSLNLRGEAEIVFNGKGYLHESEFVDAYETNANLELMKGKRVFLNIINSDNAKIIFKCGNDKTRLAPYEDIIVQDEKICSVTAYNDKRYYQETIDFTNIDYKEIYLEKNIDNLELPYVEPREGEMSIQLNQGWNLLNFFALESFDHSTLSTCPVKENIWNNKNIFFYNPDTKKYMNISEVDDYFESIEDESETEAEFYEKVNRVILSSFWIHTPVKCQVFESYYFNNYKDDYSEETGNEEYFVLDEGWNFRFVTEDMEFRTLNEIKGNCEVTSAYYFDSLLQNWDSIGLNEKLEGLFRGFIIKSENNCRFKFENEIPMPPPLPVDETESSPGGSGGAGSGSAVPCNTLSLNKCSENSKCVNYAGDYCLNVEEIGKIAGNYDCGYLETNDCEKATICKVVNSKCVAQ